MRFFKPARMRRLTPALLLSFAACATVPDAGPPQFAVPATFKEQAGESEGWVAAAPLDGADRGAWWQGFGDPVLDDLIARARQQSPTLAAALARHDAALAAARIDRADLLPQISVGADVARQRVSAGRPLASSGAQTYSVASVGGSLSYELDLWGRIRNSVQAANADAAASEADYQSARLSLDAAVADAYVRLRGLDAQADLLRQRVTAFEKAYDLTRTRHDGGIASGIDVNRANSLLANARAESSGIASRRAAAEHELAALVGALASDFSVAPVASLPTAAAIRRSVPSELLQRRPDIAAAERRVQAANSRIGVAKAAWFPSLTLGAGGGFETTSGALLSAPNGFWALGPLAATLAVFDGGARSARVRMARADHDEAASDYRETVLTAFREVEDSLAALHYLRDQSKDQQEAAAAANRTSDLAMQRYRDGASDYLEVVTAQADALSADRAVLDLKTQQARASIALVRAVGGG